MRKKTGKKENNNSRENIQSIVKKRKDKQIDKIDGNENLRNKSKSYSEKFGRMLREHDEKLRKSLVNRNEKVEDESCVDIKIVRKVEKKWKEVKVQNEHKRKMKAT